jgi:3-oxoacyl-[acyl-carrier protein] reductase
MITPTDVSLTGKTALVTGSGAGIGRAIATTFASFGARVVVVDRDAGRAEATAAGIASHGGEALPCTADVTRAADIATVKTRLIDRFGSLDILVNNVGDILGQIKPFLQTDEHEWDALYGANLRHVFLCVKAFAPLMIETGRGGSIINISSIEGFRAIPRCAVYGTFKSAIGGFVKTMALELAPYRIRINAIAPETTETEQIQPKTFTKPEHLAQWDVWNPLGRWGKPDDTAACALFLATNLSQWITGTTIHLDGGALAAGGWYRMPGEEQRWTLAPVISESGFVF